MTTRAATGKTRAIIRSAEAETSCFCFAPRSGPAPTPMHQARIPGLLETAPDPLGLPVAHTHQASRPCHTQLPFLNFPSSTSPSTTSRFRSLPLINNSSMYGRCSTPATPQWGHFKRVHMGTLLKSRDTVCVRSCLWASFRLNSFNMTVSTTSNSGWESAGLGFDSLHPLHS